MTDLNKAKALLYRQQQRHRDYMLSKGCIPENYSSQYSTDAETIASLIADVERMRSGLQSIADNTLSVLPLDSFEEFKSATSKPGKVIPGLVPTGQPIETAPKDGSWFLGFGTLHSFDEGNEYEVPQVQKTSFLHGDWYCDSLGGWSPTHWMPLPPAPEEER